MDTCFAVTPRDLPSPGCRMHGIDIGPSGGHDGGTLVLLHGGHGGWMHWAVNVAPLAEQHRVLAPDMPGFGLSSDLPQPSVASIAAALGVWLDASRVRSATLVGFSFGGLVATALAGQRPELIARLMLVNPPGLGSRSPAARRAQAEVAAIALREGERAGITQTLRGLLLSRHELIDGAMIDAALDMAQRMRFYTRDVSRAANLLPALAALPQPLQVLIGALDPHQNHELAERSERIRAARGGDADAACVVPGAAHWLQRDRADWFNQRLAQFARGQAAAPA